MSTVFPSSATKRRPLGPITGNINRVDPKNLSCTTKSAVKPGHQRKLSSQSIGSEVSSVSSSSSSTAARSIFVAKSSSGDATPTSSFAPLDESRSIFREPVIEEDVDPRCSGLLALKRANPVTEAPEIEECDDDDCNAMSFPFTRVDQSIVYEPFDTMQLRAIFRRPFMHTPELEERVEKEGLVLRLGNAISELDESESFSGESLPSLLSANEGRRTQTLEWQGLVQEGTSIVDMMR